MIIEILDNLISRLNNLFTVQTQEVIQELNKIKELLEQKQQETQVVIVEEKEISNEDTVELNYTANPSPFNPEWKDVKIIMPLDKINTEKTIEELRNEYTDKFGKKPFAWRSREVLISKIQ